MSRSVKTQSQVAKLELQILKKTCQSIDSPRSLAIFMLAHYGEYAQLLNLSINPSHYNDVGSFADDYLVTEMLKKSRSLVTGIDLEQAAYNKWLSAEELCRQSNLRLEQFRAGLVTPTKRHTSSVVARAIEIMHNCLGPLTKRTLSSIEDNMEFGPGSTTSVKGIVTRGRKFSNSELKTTQRLLDFGMFCLPHLWKEQVFSFAVQNHNELAFVPKNSKTHRSITIENDLNIFVQKGIGTMMKRKLMNIGIDTKNQWKINRSLVSHAFRDNLGTIDLSSASDTVSYELVKLFVPHDWFELLCWARPEYTRYKDTTFLIEKFSGMGCGFTFELETMIFHSILLACRELRGSTLPVSTFGDDMVCGLDIYDDVIDTLRFLGFSVNIEKSFGKSTFHESCGADFFNGQNVRPFYLRFGNFDHEEKFAIYLYCNLLRRYACHRNGGYTCDGRFLPAWLACFSKLDKPDRLFVPNWDYESEGIVGNLDEAAPTIDRRRHNGFCGFKFTRTIRESVKTARYCTGAYIASLSQSTTFTRGKEALRGKTRCSTQTGGYSLSWIDLGPWI